MKFQNNPLTKQENVIAGLTVQGYSQKEIACKLQRSIGTVAVQQRNIHEKLGINKSTELTKWWFCSMFDISDEQLKKKLKEVGALLLTVLFGVHTVLTTDQTMIRRLRCEERRHIERIEPRKTEE